MTAEAREPMKPCPFCGLEPEGVPQGDEWLVDHDNEDCPGNGFHHSEVWNRRAPDANVSALVKAARVARALAEKIHVSTRLSRSQMKNEAFEMWLSLREALKNFPEEQ